jgi:TPR repeat protein
MTIAKKILTLLVLFAPFPAHGSDSFALCRTLFQQGQYAMAVSSCTEAAEKGNLDAQLWLGLIYTKGKGVPQDYARALKWKKMAAMQGDPTAEFTYGRMFEQGLGVRQDYQEALKWYKKAVAKGNAEARYSLGSLYSKGHGVKKDPVRAYAWYMLAADQGMYLAEEARDRLKQRMSAEQLVQAQKLAEQLRVSGNQEQ